MRTLTMAGVLLALASLGGDAAAHGKAEPADAGTARAIQFPDTGAHRTLVADLHTHSVFSDGHVWPRIRVEEALRDGLDALAVTEHLEYQPHRADLPHPDRNRAHQLAAEAAGDSELIVIRGSEITRSVPAGHMNAIFIDDANELLRVEAPPPDPADADAYYEAAGRWPAQAVVRAANEQGAFLFWNHPFFPQQRLDGVARMTDFHAQLLRDGQLHGIEVANGRIYSEEALQLALDHDLTMIGVSDVHDLIDWDYEPAAGGHRPVTLVFAKERSAGAIREALFAKRTVVWFQNLLIGRPAQIGPLLAACVTLEGAHYAPDTEILEVRFVNHSDARFVLRNAGDETFMWHSDLLELPPHSATEVQVKPGAAVDRLELRFEVLNAWTAPKKHPLLELAADVGDVPPAQAH